MRNRILYPKASRNDLLQCFKEIEVFDSYEDSVKKRLKEIGDLPRIHRRLINGDVTPADVLTLDQTYARAEQIAFSLSTTALAYRGAIISKIHSAFSEVFSVEKALKMENGVRTSDTMFCFQPGKAPSVDALEAECERLSSTLVSIVKTITDWLGLGQDALRLDFKETISPTIIGPKASMIALKRAMEAKAHPFKKMEIITRKSSSHLEIPEIATTWFAIQRRKVDLQEAIKVALLPLCDELGKGLYMWDELESWLALVDVSYTLWKCAKEYGFVKPTLLEGYESSLHVEGLRHPLIERKADRQEYVKHRVNLDADESGWLVYGMNASGKSSLMKAVGIAVILAQAGSYVPATSFRFVPFKSLFTRILNTDNLWAGLSSFAVEMTELREILGRADSNTLVLGDELCSGTESISATALVGASLTYLHKVSAKFIFATHFHGLLTIPSVSELPRLKVWHLKVRHDPVADVLVYERVLTPGPGSSLYGLEVAKAMNLPDEILTDALAIRRSLLGSSSVLDAPISKWNAQIQRRVCEICSADITSDLEVHHIQQRAHTINGRNSDGTHQNDLRNLIVVCSKCHDNIHDASISVGPLQQTSDGLKRSIVKSVSTEKSVTRYKSLTDDEFAVVEDYLKSYPTVTSKRAIFDMEQKGISITTATLKALRKDL